MQLHGRRGLVIGIADDASIADDLGDAARLLTGNGEFGDAGLLGTG
jgi:enoyl-[acyl-carrier-protein] reductase (NADH)